MPFMSIFPYKPKVNDRVEITWSKGTPYTVIKKNNDGTFDIGADTGLKLNNIDAKDIKIISSSKSGGRRRKSRKTKRSRKSRKSRKSRRKMTKRRRR